MSIIYNGVELPYLYYNGQPTSGYYNGVCVWPTSQPSQNGWYMKHFDDSDELKSYITNKNNNVFPYDWSMDLHTTMNYNGSGQIGPDLATIRYNLSACIVDSIAYTATASTWTGTITASFAGLKMFDNNVSFIYSANQTNNSISWADALEPYDGQLQLLLGGLSNPFTANTNLQGFSAVIAPMHNSYHNDSTAKIFNNTAAYNGISSTDNAYNNMQINQSCGTEQTNFPSVSSVIGNTYFVLSNRAWTDGVIGTSIQVTANTADIDEVKNRLDNFVFSSHLVPTWTFSGANNGYFAFNASVYPSAQGETGVLPIV